MSYLVFAVPVVNRQEAFIIKLNGAGVAHVSTGAVVPAEPSASSSALIFLGTERRG